MTAYRFDFPPDVQAQRARVLAAIHQATALRTLPTVRTALRLMTEWLSEHSDDYAVWEAGEVMTKLEDALLQSALPETLSVSGRAA